MSCSDSTALLLTCPSGSPLHWVFTPPWSLLPPQAPAAAPVALPWMFISHHAFAPATVSAQNVLHDFRASSVGSRSSFLISLPTYDKFFFPRNPTAVKALTFGICHLVLSFSFLWLCKLFEGGWLPGVPHGADAPGLFIPQS